MFVLQKVLERTNIAKEKLELEFRASKQPQTALEVENDSQTLKTNKNVLELKSEPSSAISEHTISIGDKKMLVAAYKSKISVLAKQIFNSEIDVMTKKLSEYKEIAIQSLNEIERMKLDKPLNPFKVNAWKEQLTQVVQRYNNGIKVNYDNLLSDIKKFRC